MSANRISKAAARAAQKRYKRRLESKRKRKAARRRGQIRDAYTPSKKVGGAHPKVKRKTIDLPENFNLHSNYEAVMEAMNKFRAAVANPLITKHRQLSVNFDNIANIDVAAALVLAADINVWQMTKGKLTSRHKKWQPQIRGRLNDMGLFELLNMPPLPESGLENDQTSFIKFNSGQKAEGEKAKELRENIEKIMKADLTADQRSTLFTSLTEALVNVTQHAYDSSDKPLSYSKWWITAAHVRKNGENQLTVAIYDRGLTIPATMHRSKKWEKVLQFIPKDLISQDSRLIEAAMRESHAGGDTRTRTKEVHRGKGLKHLLKLAALENGGKVHIISGKGRCCFAVENGNLLVKSREEAKNPMRGTLVEWQIRV